MYRCVVWCCNDDGVNVRENSFETKIHLSASNEDEALNKAKKIVTRDFYKVIKMVEVRND